MIGLRASVHPHRQVRLDRRLEHRFRPSLYQSHAPARYARSINGHLALKQLLATELLPVEIMHSERHHQPRLDPRRPGFPVRNPAECLLENGPANLIAPPHQRVLLNPLAPPTRPERFFPRAMDRSLRLRFVPSLSYYQPLVSGKRFRPIA